MTPKKPNNKQPNLYHHELLDRIHCLCVMYEEMIINHDSDDILSEAEKDEVLFHISSLYQKVGSRMD